MPKLMPSLRHTKSEEHLDTNLTSAKPNTVDPTTNITSETPAAIATTTPINNRSNTPTAITNIKINIDRVPSDVSAAATPPAAREWNEYGMTEDDVWSQEEDEITAQYLKLHKVRERDAVSQMSLDSIDSREQSMCFLLFNFL